MTYLPAAREGNVFTGVYLSTIGPHGYSFTARPCYGAVGTHPTGMLSSQYLPPVYRDKGTPPKKGGGSSFTVTKTTLIP